MSGHPVLPAEKITLPLLPLRDVVVFPHMVILVRRPSESIKALEVAMEARQIMLVAEGRRQGRAKPDDMFESAASRRFADAQAPDGTVKVLVGACSARSAQRFDNGSTSSPRSRRCRPSRAKSEVERCAAP